MPRAPTPLALALAAVAVAAGTAALGWRRVWPLSPDAVEYVGSARAFAEGRGLVDPVQYSYFLPGAVPPQPTIHIVAPVLPLLLALPLWLGASLPTVFALHLLYASAIGGAAAFVGRRALSLPGSIGFAIAVAWSPAYVWSAHQLLTEASSIGVMLAFLAAAGPCLLAREDGRGPPRLLHAVALAVLAWVGWLTRPNLALLVPAALCAAALETSPRRALRAPAPWIFTLVAAGLWLATTAAVVGATGRAPYAHYALLPQLLKVHDVRLFRAEYPGTLAFALEHARAVAALLAGAAARLAHELFLEPVHHWVGWLALPGLARAFACRGRGGFERRLAAIAAIVFALCAIATGSSFAPQRYVLPTSVCLWFTGLGALDDAARALERRAPRSLAHGLPLAVALAAVAAASATLGSERFADVRALGHRGIIASSGRAARAARAFCSRVPRDALVASVDPWAFYLWCGNAALWVPTDLSDEAWVGRYLDSLRPAYFVLSESPVFAALRASPRLERVADAAPQRLYRVTPEPEGSPHWDAPPPLGAR